MSPSRHSREKESDKKEKKVHYSASTKSSSPTMVSHGHHSSSHRLHRSSDSGVGSSLVSDRASVGTTAHSAQSTHFYTTASEDIEDLRRALPAVQEALNAANSRIERLERLKREVDEQLSAAHSENRKLKRENGDLVKNNSELGKEIGAFKARLQALSSGATSISQSTGSSASRNRDDTRPPTVSASRRPEERPHRRRDSISTASARRSTSHVRTSDGDRRSSRAYDLQPAAEVRPNNPFAPQSPRSSTPRTVPLMSPPTSVAYSQAPIAYSSAPVYPQPASQRLDPYPNDGLYHPYPL